jgi:pimeloyl-ACP methyl ester carboxylesterase
MTGSGLNPAENASAQLPQILRLFRENHPKQSLLVGNDAWEYMIGGAGGHSVLILGGGGSTAESMFPVNAALEADAQVISMSIPTTASTIDAVVEGMRAIMDSLQLRQAIFLGHSLGGILAQAFAVRHPERVAGLALCNTGFYLGARAKLLPASVALMARAPQALLPRAVSSQMSRLLKPAHAADFWRRFYQDELNQPDAGARLKHQAILMLDSSRFFRDHPISHQLGWTQSIPVQVIASPDDRGFTRRETAFLASLYARSETTMLPEGAGHLSFLTRPEEYLDAVQRLLIRVSTEARPGPGGESPSS